MTEARLDNGDTADETVETLQPRNRFRFGIGSKVPTQYKVRVGQTWYRVYCNKWSRKEPLYIVSKGKAILVTLDHTQGKEKTRET